MRIESDGHSRGNPRLYELIEHAPKTGKSPTVWAWPELIDYLKVAGQPVAGPWPPHQQPRPDPEEDSLPVAVPDPESRPAAVRQEAPDADARTLTRAPRTPGGSYVSVAVPVRGAAVARRGDQPAARRRRLRQGAGRRPEPGSADEAALRVTGAHRGHQQRARSGLPPGRTGRHPAHRRPVPARRPGALGSAEDHAADDGRGRPADRRPHRPQPRHPGRLAVPRRPSG